MPTYATEGEEAVPVLEATAVHDGGRSSRSSRSTAVRARSRSRPGCTASAPRPYRAPRARRRRPPSRQHRRTAQPSRPAAITGARVEAGALRRPPAPVLERHPARTRGVTPLRSARGRLAQLVRAPALQAGGRAFEPRTAHPAADLRIALAILLILIGAASVLISLGPLSNLSPTIRTARRRRTCSMGCRRLPAASPPCSWPGDS